MNPTVLIGLDGATFTILDHLMENDTMPFLREFVRGGVRAKLLSTANPLTPPAWVSLMTGRSPGHHGVFDFIWAEERDDEVFFTLYNFRDIRCETIWSIVSRENGKACTLNFPMMSPPPAISGYVVPGLVSWKHLRRNTYPQQLYDELKALPNFDARILAWDFDLEKKAERGVSPEEYESWVNFHILRERQWFELIRYLMKQHPCDLTAIIFDGVDKILHMGWQFLDPTLQTSASPTKEKLRALCLQYFRELDGFLAEIAHLAGVHALIFMASDHGFGPSWQVIRVNSWLSAQGYLTWRQFGELDEAGRESVKRLVEKHFVLLDWDKTTAYARTATSNGIYIRVAQKPGQTGISPDRYGSFRGELVEKLLALSDPESGEPVIKKVLTREEAYPGPHNAQAPDLTLVMRDHSFISILDKKPVVYRRPYIEGTHYPEGIFLARGPGIRQGEALPPLAIVDVPCALLYSLGVAVPQDFEGRLPAGMFDRSLLEECPYRIGAPTLPPDTYVIQPGKGKELNEEEEIMKQLVALGYIEG